LDSSGFWRVLNLGIRQVEGKGRVEIDTEKDVGETQGDMFVEVEFDPYQFVEKEQAGLTSTIC
jgi:hypothetical protein